MRDNFLFKSREVDDRSRSTSREREKKDGLSRQYTRNSTLEGAKLHIGHLPQSITEEVLEAEFEKFGKVDDLRLVKKDMNGQQLKGRLYAFVTMCLAEDAQSAMEQINQDHNLGWNVSYSREKVNRENSRSPQRNPRQKPKFIEDTIEERLFKRPQQNYLASENESQEQSQNLNLDIDNICAIEAKEAPKESSDNPDDFISYNNNENDDFCGDNHSLMNDNYNGFNDNDTAETEESTAYSNNLMSLLCSNENEHQPKPKEVVKPVHVHSEKSNQLTSSLEKKILNGNSILVRELWLGNLTQNISECELRDIVSQFGEVENIEDYIKPTTRFAFVKFKTINQASKANEAIQQLKNQLSSPNLKIAFSDHQRRKNVIGNAIDFEIDEDLTPIVYIGFSTGAMITGENNIRDMFSRFRGEVLNIGINQMPKQHSAKSYALVEMGSKEQAKVVRQRLYFDDVRRENRIRLGDKNCEICILSKPRARENFCIPNHGPNQGMHRHFQPNFQHHPMGHPHHRMNGPYGPQNGHYNGPRDHLGNPINFQNHPRNHFQEHPHPFMGHEHMDGPHPNINRFGHPGGMEMMNHGFPMEHMGNPHFHNPSFNPNFMNHPNCGPNGPNGPNFGPHPFHGFNPNMQHMHQNFNPNMHNNNFDEFKRHPTMDFSDTLNSLAASTTASSNSKSPKEKGFSDTTETNSEAMWSGFIVKSKQNRVAVDALLLQGDDSLLKNVFNLNISHRVMYDELPDKPIKAMMTFIPSDSNHGEQFNGLVKYFLERSRAGFVNLDNHTLYLLPPCERASEFHQIGNNELLGIIFDSKDPLPKSKFGRMASEIKFDQDEDSEINEALSILRNSDFGNLLI